MLHYHEQVFDWYPALLPLRTSAEESFHGDRYVDWTREHFHYAVWLVAAYLAMCALAQPLCKLLGGPYQLQHALALWNGALAAFSTAGFLRVAPHLFGLIHRKSLHFAVCAEPGVSYGHGTSGLWTFLFIYSKVPELLDTLFLLLRGKRIDVLQWFHHASVLLFVMQSYGYRSSVGLWFIAMNYGVHAAMYSYFAAMALRIRLPRVCAQLVTLLQIAQMLVGIGLLGLVGFYWHTGLSCSQSRANFAVGVAVYSSYLVLFLLLYVDKYCRGARPKPASTKDE